MGVRDFLFFRRIKCFRGLERMLHRGEQSSLHADRRGIKIRQEPVVPRKTVNHIPCHVVSPKSAFVKTFAMSIWFADDSTKPFNAKTAKERRKGRKD
jgi:hypothetical protein